MPVFYLVIWLYMEVVFCGKDKELLPVRATEGSIGLDIKVAEETVIQPKSISLVNSGLKVMLPKGLALCMYLRSSTPMKKWLIMANAVGVIDSDYRWEIKLQLYNITDEPVELSAGERIWQLIIVQQAGVKEVNLSDVICNGFCDTNMYNNFEEMFPTWRWGWGFGSTWI